MEVGVTCEKDMWRPMSWRETTGVFTLVTRSHFFDVSVKILMLNPMVRFLTSAQKTPARHPM